MRIRVEAFGLNRSELKLRLRLSEGVSFPPGAGIEAAGTEGWLLRDRAQPRRHLDI